MNLPLFSRAPPSSHPQGQNVENSSKSNLLGPHMNSLNRSRSRSPSYSAYQDTRRSASPNVQRKNLAPPQNRSRSPTPNFTSTQYAKLSKSPQKTQNQGPQSLPYIPTYQSQNSHQKINGSKHVSSIQIPVDGKSTMKTETTLQINDNLTDHSDNASEVSDEGYRSLGVIAGERNKNRTSLYSQNSADDAEDHGVYF